MRLTVIGCGYLGATHAACMAELGHDVLGVDSDPERVHLLNQGKAPFFEAELNELLVRHTCSGRLRFTTSYAQAGSFAEVHFLTLDSPQTNRGGPMDLSHLLSAVRKLSPHLRQPSLVVGRSTVPVGTAARLADYLKRISAAGTRTHLAWNPEFLRESTAIHDTLYPDRIVVGLEGEDAADDEAVLRQVYGPVLRRGAPFLVTDIATSELVKWAANAFVATKISFINAMAELCEATRADVHQLAEALAYDERIGAAGMWPGLGFGGGSLTKDIHGFMAAAAALGTGQSLGFLREVDAVNIRRRTRVVWLARHRCGGCLDGKRIAVWGAAFKPMTDSVRDSPALAVAHALYRKGAQVVVHDPMALDEARKSHPHLTFSEDLVECTVEADLLLHLTDWPQYRTARPEKLTDRVARPHVIDARGVLDPLRWRRAGWTYECLGRPLVPYQATGPDGHLSLRC
ncbi:UDP-glucose dehydrogenase family protein [Streptacidiphilus melanogenes]|uniref:UDP-glucose dehydrogenase family protein n=1 Tax=Streptacidiphilus melanogenes TaxID=411235 RepID=UPI0005AB0832|nr:UDP-glucose/GDP-mannose dehydrogenase family protein [Streptacidiphilus melanogenes]